MGGVRCSGTESALQQCEYNPTHDCPLHKAATVGCEESPDCPEGWTPGFGKCYRLFAEARSIKLAASVCAMEDASLVNVLSKEENHFLSNLVANSAPEIHQWHTGAVIRKGKWNWHKLVEKRPRGRGRPSRKMRRTSRFKEVRSPLAEEIWFPGWPSHENQYAEPTTRGRKECLTLSNRYRDPNGGYRDLDYFFWKADWCARRAGINFICQIELTKKTIKEKDCYIGDSATYRGETAVSQTGATCLSWADSLDVNDYTHPGKGLGEHNFCRNPDDSDRPWCWVNHAKRLFDDCDIPRCPTSSESPTTTSSPPEIRKCDEDEFYCPLSRACIPGSFQCDFERDCLSGEDEKDCDYALYQFSPSQNKGLLLSDQYIAGASGAGGDTESVSWSAAPTNETCAKRCLATTRFVCRSFVYTPSNQTCLILRYNSLHGELFTVPGSTFYELDSQRNCTGKFQCNNMFCVDLDKTCDGNDDCKDNSDELSCDGEKADVTVRLVGGDDDHSGTVEITYMGNTGVICDDHWDMKDATVICRMLGYRAAETFSVVNYFDYPRSKAEILLDDVKCRGDETTIADCPAAPFKTHDCNSYEIAGVRCKLPEECEIEQFKCSDEMCVQARHVCDGERHCEDGSDEANCGNHSVELVNGLTQWEGRVQVTVAGLSGSICNDQWDDADAAVVCRTLGMNYGGVAISELEFGQGSGPVWLDNVQCQGGEENLDECPHGGWGVHDCDHSEDAAVRCFTSLQTTTTEEPTTLLPTTSPTMELQLVGGQDEHMGNIALVVDGTSYRVCDDHWDNTGASVVCRMLGYRGGIATAKSYFGTGDNLILLDDVKCNGAEMSLYECDKIIGTNNHNCRNNRFAGVICTKNVEPTEISEPPPIPTATYGFCGHRPYDTMDVLVRRRRSLIAGDSAGWIKPSIPTKLHGGQKEPKPRIVGGNFAPHGKYPWQVGIRLHWSRLKNGSYSVDHWCGGTVISEHWIISAAHCFDHHKKWNFRIMVGDHNNQLPERGEQEFRVEKIVKHKNYRKGRNYDYDIALLKVKKVNERGIIFSKTVQPACLPTPETPYLEGTMCETSGWGHTVLGGTGTKVLNVVSVPLLEQAKCQYLYHDYHYSRRMVCAGYVEGGKDSCSGDSGGPLVCKIRGVYTLMGITSWGVSCGQPNAPGVYSLVQEFLPWIHENVQEHSDSTREKALPPRHRAG